MDNSIASKERIKNEKKNPESNPHPPDSFSKEKMDNDSLCNNNYSSQTQRLSFIPVRSRSNLQEKYTLPKNKSCDDNRAVTSHRALAGNLSYPASPYRSGIRRHSLGIDDLSNDLSIHVNSNQSSRFQSLGRRTTTSSTNSSVSFNFTSFEQVANGRSTYEEHLLTQKPNQNEKFADQSPNTRSPRQFNSVHLEPAQFSEKVKDKSFVRKSSLNRIEFVNSAHQLNDTMPHTSFIFTPEQHSTSEANSDHQQQSQVEGSSILLTKKRNNSFRANRKEISGRQTKQDFPGLTIRKEESMVPLPLHPKTQENIAWWRNKKASFKKKSYSAGEQDSVTDNSEAWKWESHCFSAQEIDSQDYMLKRVNKKVMSDQPKKTLQSPPLLPYEKTLVHTEVSGDAKSMLKDQRNTCDNTSQTSAAEVFGACHGTSISQDVPSEKNRSQPNIFNSDDDNNILQKNSNSDSINPLPEDEPLDGDLFISSTSPILKNSSLPFPINNIEAESSVTLATTPKNNEDNENISDPLVDTDDNITKVSSEISSLEISTDSLETNAKDITEDDSSRQPNSILRKKSPDDKKGIQGILKYAGDEKLAWQPPSILKHRESSEEKDNWSQPDLHSILKKSASEDESCNGNTDIRPILKNVSTDDESSGLGSKPKPILKKRTSFSEECSYACFSSGELKPILKKKTINEICEDQPKPILKTRRKSEEATASISEFPLGTRPRAYSADRGVKMCNEKKSLDDDFT